MKMAKGQTGPGLVLVSGTRIRKAIWTNIGQAIRQQLNAYFMRYSSHFLFYPEKLCRMKVMALPHPFQTFS